MRWAIYFILAFLMLGIQQGLVSYVSFRDVGPNLPALLVIFICLNAPRGEAMLASLLIGALQDLVSLQPLGLFAFSYGIVALVVCWLAESVGRGHPVTHVSLAFMTAMIVGILLLIHDLVRTASPAAPHVGPRVVVVQAVYTTLLAPLVIFILQQSNRLLALDPGSRRRKHV